MSLLQAEYVKQGYWLNVKNGPIMGQTITTDVRTGSLVVALLAVLTTFALGHLWDIFIFSYHQIRAKDKTSDGHFHQQQALLRTLPPPNALASSWIKLWWTWRGKADHVFRRTWAMAMLSVVFTVLTVAVGIFVSYVISNTDIEVLVDSPLCGPLDTEAYGNRPANSTDYHKYTTAVRTVSRAYSQECYHNAGILPAQCSTYVQPNISFTKTREDCPFKNMCKSIEQPGVSMDSGFIDVNNAFGLNLKSRDRVKFRRKNTCAFLEHEGRYKVINRTGDPSAQIRFQEIVLLYFGAEKNKNNNTFAVSYLTANYTPGYGMMELQTFSNDPDSDSLIPLPELKTTDADLTVAALLKHGVRYLQPVNDPAFAAHKKRVSVQNHYNTTYYLSDFPAAAFACKEQYQFCFKQSNSSDFCTPLQGRNFSDVPQKDFPGATSTQIATLQLLQISTSMMNTDSAIISGVKAGDTYSRTGLIPDLPDDQWLQELVGWEAHVWAGLQVMVTDYAVGMAARAPSTLQYTKNATNEGEKNLCRSIRMRMSGGFVNINVFALAFVITLTMVFTILDVVLLRIIIYTDRCRDILSPRIDRWIQDGVFHLQRRAYETQENVEWERLDKEIPVTVGRERLPGLKRGGTFATLVEKESDDGKAKHDCEEEIRWEDARS